MSIEKALGTATKVLEKQAREDFEFWKKNNSIVAEVVFNAEIREPSVAKALKTVWEKGFLAGYLRAVEASGLLKDE